MEHHHHHTVLERLAHLEHRQEQIMAFINDLTASTVTLQNAITALAARVASNTVTPAEASTALAHVTSATDAVNAILPVVVPPPPPV